MDQWHSAAFGAVPPLQDGRPATEEFDVSWVTNRALAKPPSAAQIRRLAYLLWGRGGGPDGVHDKVRDEADATLKSNGTTAHSASVD